MSEDVKTLEDVRREIEEQKSKEKAEALKDFNNFEKRYAEFLDKNKKPLEQYLENAYYDYRYYLKQNVFSSNYAIAIAVPLFIVFAIAIGFSSKHDNATTRAICATAFGVFPLCSVVITSKLRDSIINTLFRRYERNRVLERNVRQEETEMLKKLMSNDSLPQWYLYDQYTSIRSFYGRCLTKLEKEDFTYSYKK